MPSGAIVTLDADAETLRIGIHALDEASLDETKAVVADHLDRFAFREPPLRIRWSETSDAG